MTAPITLILGGARSGKSSYAEKMAAELGRSVLYIATAEAGDTEMAHRIDIHRQSRPTHWRTLEVPIHAGQALAQIDQPPDVLLLDCLTLLISNLVLKLEEEPLPAIEQAAVAEVDELITAQRRLHAPLIVVSNEVGLGVVPPYKLGRTYRDVLGRANKHLAARAERVLFMVAGLPMTVKDEVTR